MTPVEVSLLGIGIGVILSLASLAFWAGKLEQRVTQHTAWRTEMREDIKGIFERISDISERLPPRRFREDC